MFDLTGEHIVILGGSSGIGLAVARAAGRADVVTDREPKEKYGMRRVVYLIAALAALSMACATVPESPGNRYVPASKVPWVDEPGAPVQLGPLWGERASGEAGTLLRTPAGFRSGPHSHTADYWAVVVQGVWEHWVPSTGEGKGIRLESGSHWTQVKTQLHEDACVSDAPCIIFLFNKTPYVTEFPSSRSK